MILIKDAIKGNSRASNALAREGLYTMNALHGLRQALGEKEFKERINDIRAFGSDSWDKLCEAMREHPYSSGDLSGDALSEGLPDGFRERLIDTLRYLAARGATYDQRLLGEVPNRRSVQDLLPNPKGGSITAGDLEELAKLFLGNQYDLDLRGKS